MGSDGVPGQGSGVDNLCSWEQRLRFPSRTRPLISRVVVHNITVTMEANDKTLETKKPDVEEKNLVNTVQETKKIIASEENKSETGITSKNNTESKQTVKNESNDTEDIGFEIITSDLAEKKENVVTKSETARSEVISKPLPEDTNIKDEISKQPEIKKNEHPVDASLTDIKIIKEEDDGSNKDSSESDAQNSEELELALKEIPELS